MCRDPELGKNKDSIDSDKVPPKMMVGTLVNDNINVGQVDSWECETETNDTREFIPTAQHEIHLAEKHCGKDSQRVSILKFVNSPSIQRGLIGLLFFDILILFVHLFLSAEYPTCTIIVRDAVSCSPKERPLNEESSQKGEGWESWIPADNEAKHEPSEDSKDSSEGWESWKAGDNDNSKEGSSKKSKKGEKWESWIPHDIHNNNSTTHSESTEDEWESWRPADNEEDNEEEDDTNSSQSEKFANWKPVETKTKYNGTDSITKEDFETWVPKDSGGGNRILEIPLLYPSGDVSDHDGVCGDNLERNEYSTGCDEEKHFNIRKVQNVLFEMSITILLIFFMEIMFLMTCLGMCEFCSNLFYLMDLFVVGISLSLEIYFKLISLEPAVSVTGVVVLLRLWRCIRVGMCLAKSENDKNVGGGNKEDVAYVRQLEILMRQSGLDVPQKMPKEL